MPPTIENVSTPDSIATPTPAAGRNAVIAPGLILLTWLLMVVYGLLYVTDWHTYVLHGEETTVTVAHADTDTVTYTLEDPTTLDLMRIEQAGGTQHAVGTSFATHVNLDVERPVYNGNWLHHLAGQYQDANMGEVVARVGTMWLFAAWLVLVISGFTILVLLAAAEFPSFSEERALAMMRLYVLCVPMFLLFTAAYGNLALLAGMVAAFTGLFVVLAYPYRALPANEENPLRKPSVRLWVAVLIGMSLYLTVALATMNPPLAHTLSAVTLTFVALLGLDVVNSKQDTPTATTDPFFS
jgi:hypothetical protein